MPSASSVTASSLFGDFLSDAGHAPPLYLPMMAWDDLSALERRRAQERLRADQERRVVAASRQGRNLLSEAVEAHLAACRRVGCAPLVSVPA